MRGSQYSKDHDDAAQALIDAGFAPLTAAVLTRVNRWLFPFTILVTGTALLWIGVHLWPDLDADTWQVWVDDNAGFFAPLDVGATIGIVPDFHSHMGLLIRKERESIAVERHLWIDFDAVPVGLVVTPEAAELLLQLDFDAPRFWDEWQAIAEDPGIHVYQHLSRGSPHSPGYRAFVSRLSGADDR